MKVLLAEDDPLSQFRLQSLLEKWGYEIMKVADGTEAWAALQAESAPPLAILDWMLPGMSGLEVCKLVRRGSLKRYTYIVLLTGKDSPDDVLKGWEAGADDYVVKPFDAHELRVRLQAGKRIIGLQAELITTREELRVRASHDQLTGLWGESASMEMLKMELARSLREQTPGALCVLALDRYAQIHETWGYLAADAVLCQIAHRMRSALRAYDILGRYRGGSFLLVLPGIKQNEATTAAQRLVDALSAPLEIAEGTLSPACSLGLATWDGQRQFEAEALLQSAEEARQQARRAGGNRLEVAATLEVRA